MFDIARKTFKWGQNTVTLETGEISRQASGAVLVTMDDTVLLCTVVAAKSAKPGQDFFPLTVDYVEKFYAAGRIPGGFFKREGRPTEREILICRLIDRPLRPLFPDGFYNEVQVIIQVMTSNPEVDSDIPAMMVLRLRWPFRASRSAARSAPRAWATSTASMCSTRASPR